MASAAPKADPVQESCRLLTTCREVSAEPEKTYPPMSSIPRTPEDRLHAPPTTVKSVLYLAYGSNLCAETFLGVRGIRPISRIPVSAPTLDLTFNLAGFPYLEPCFANSAPRKLPKLPDPTNPPKPPKIPPFEPPTRTEEYGDEDAVRTELDGASQPVKWTKGLIGVVYEVTPEDYITILATEGGGSSYADILVPCFPLPPRMSVPEKPPIDLPKPFFAHTLFAPSVPGELPPELGQPDKPGKSDDDNDDPKDKLKWYSRFLLPPRREPPGYAQASPRYLNLIRDGARENELPEDYQAYLASLQAYNATSCRQKLGRMIFLMPFLIVKLLSGMVPGSGKTPKAPKKAGKFPPWLAAILVISLNLVWMAYDALLKPLFGDGEHTQEPSKEKHVTVSNLKRRWRGAPCSDEEKRGLLAGAYEDED